MRFSHLLVLLALTTSCAAVASEPGQPLDCSDWVFLEPGYACEQITGLNCEVSPGELGPCLGVDDRADYDNEGRLIEYWTRPSGTCGPYTLNRAHVRVFEGTTYRTIAYLDERCYGQYRIDRVTRNGFLFDRQSGALFLTVCDNCESTDGGCEYEHNSCLPWSMRIVGFTPLFDVLQSFTPTISAVGFRVPSMPEGMAGADYFDTYFGNLTKPIDFAQAQPLACGYPAASPAVGDYLEVADALPNPAPGTGRYYVTATTYQGQTRYGRKTSGGRLRGRDPSTLPACDPPPVTP